MMIVAGPAVLLLSGGFNDRDARASSTFAVELTRITFPYLLFISLVSLLGGILNSLHPLLRSTPSPRSCSTSR